MSKRKILFILLFCLTLIFTACEGGEAETSAPSETDAPVQTLPTLVENGEAAYAIVLPERSNGDIRNAANSFADKLGDIYGVKFEVKKNSKLAEGKKLIMIGAQAEDEYSSYYADVPYREYAMKLTDDGNIVIAAWSVDAIGDCCSKFIMRLKKSFDSGDTAGTITDEVLVKGVDSAIIEAEVPHFSLNRMPLIYHIAGARGAYGLCFKDSTADDWNSYVTKLTDEGFSLIQKNENTDASFAVLGKNGTEITVDYWTATKELAILVDKPSYQSPLKAENVTATTTPVVIEPGLEYAGALKGMCYVIQASDGSFIIIDSGDSDPKFLDRLYSVLTERVAAGSKPHIRAWFITHAHGDHMSGVVDIAASKYASLIECDAVYTNMPHESYQTAYDKSTYASRISKLEKAAKTLGADYVIARTGQTYYFADLEVQMLCTVDDMFMTEYNDLDETSLVFTVKTASKKLIFTGDAGPIVIGQYVMKRYTAATLKCDISQANSHGANNSAHTQFYKAVDPDIYLWPASIEFYNKHTPNKHIQSDSTAKIVYSYNGLYTIELN
ncbi:MAG: MBL fold metallo-hydrolase [Clostridia bacterium]|nr:MBL fold metallo-hydrolase [Clostridia bacterium]